MKKLLLLCMGSFLALSSITASPVCIEPNKMECSCSLNASEPSMEEIIQYARYHATFRQMEILNEYSISLSPSSFYRFYKPVFIRVRKKLNLPVDEDAIHPHDPRFLKINPDINKLPCGPYPGPNPYTYNILEEDEIRARKL